MSDLVTPDSVSDYVLNRLLSHYQIPHNQENRDKMREFLNHQEQQEMIKVHQVLFDSPFGANLSGTFSVDQVSYHWITDTIAIGDCTSAYEPFDLIVNLNYPCNKVSLNGIGIHYLENNKTVFTIGLEDTPNSKLTTLFDSWYKQASRLIQENREDRGSPRILFHCYAGRSRSVAFALAYLHLCHSMDLREGLVQIKQKRLIAEPNSGFQKQLLTWSECIKYE